MEPAIVSRMLQRAFEYLPGLSSLSGIRVWTGFRPATPDKLPLVGPWIDDPTLYVATGHEGLGITTSLATAKLISRAHFGRRRADSDGAVSGIAADGGVNLWLRI